MCRPMSDSVFIPLPLKRMKKFLNGVAALAAMAVIALPACSGSGSNIAETTQSADTTATVAEAPAPAAEAVVEVAPGTANLDAYKEKLTVVDFNALWCGPCRKYAPTFHAVAAKMADKANFLSVNVDSCPAIAEAYVQQYIPQTTVILPDGRKFDKVGELSEAELTAFVDSAAAL